MTGYIRVENPANKGNRNPVARKPLTPAQQLAYEFRKGWPDTGCKESPKCLTCPLPECVEDQPTENEVRRRRNAEIRAMRESGAGIQTIADEYKLSERAIHRIVAKK